MLDGVLPAAGLSYTQTSDRKNNRWNLLKIQKVHASNSWNLGAWLGQLEGGGEEMGRGKGMSAADYFKESVCDNSEMQAHFQQARSTIPGSALHHKIVKGF